MSDLLKIKRFMCISDVYSSREFYTSKLNVYSSPIALYVRPPRIEVMVSSIRQTAAH